jgi:hypothetical protein
MHSRQGRHVAPCTQDKVDMLLHALKTSRHVASYTQTHYPDYNPTPLCF